MRLIEINAGGWKDVHDCIRALLQAIGSPRGHGSSIDAFIDSMVWGGITQEQIEPPYTIRITNTKNAPKDALEFIRELKDGIAESRKEHQVNEGEDVEVSIEMLP